MKKRSGIITLLCTIFTVGLVLACTSTARAASNGTVKVDTLYTDSNIETTNDRNDAKLYNGTVSYSIVPNCYVCNLTGTVNGKRRLGNAGAYKTVTFNSDGVVVIDAKFVKEGDPDWGNTGKLSNAYFPSYFGLYTDPELQKPVTEKYKGKDIEVKGQLNTGRYYDKNIYQEQVAYQVKRNKTYYLGAYTEVFEGTDAYDTILDKNFKIMMSMRHYKDYGTGRKTLKDKASLYVGAGEDGEKDFYDFKAPADGVVTFTLSSITGWDKNEHRGSNSNIVYYTEPALSSGGKKINGVPYSVTYNGETHKGVSDFGQKNSKPDGGNSNIISFGVKKDQTYQLDLVKDSYDPAAYKIRCDFTKIDDKGGATKSKALSMKKNTTYKGSTPAGASYTRWYKIELAAPANMYVDFADDGSTNGVDYKLYNSSMKEVHDAGHPSPGQKETYMPAGTYYVKVTKGTDGYGGEYTLKWNYTKIQNLPKYTVKFNANGGTKLSKSSVKVISGVAIGTLPTASRSGYLLKGWYTARSGGTKVTSSTKIKKNMTLYAHWTKAYTVKFNGNGGKPGKSSLKVATGAAIGTLPTASRSGYKITGWYTKKAGGKKVTAKTKIKKNQTLYAHWTKAYTVKFDANGGGGGKQSVSVAKGAAIGKFPFTGWEYRTFKGWYTKKSGGKKISTRTKITKNQTFYAHWEKVSVKKPSAPTVKKAASRQMTVQIKKVSGAKGYVIAYSTNPKFIGAKKVRTTSLKKTISKLEMGTTYYVRVRAYKEDSLENKVYGKYSNAVKINVK